MNTAVSALLLTTAVTVIVQKNNLEWNPETGGDCSFACKFIPPNRNVLRTLEYGTMDALSADKIKVVAWNLYKGREKSFYFDFIKATKGADIVLTSEATTPGIVKDTFLSLSGFGWEFATNFMMKDNVATGLAIGSEVRAKDVGFSRTDDLEPFVKAPKATMWCFYPIANKKERLMAISIHGINWDGDDALRRQLEKVLPVIKRHSGPVVFAGDFNTKNDERLKIANSVLAREGLKYIALKGPIKKQLDHAFSRGLIVKGAKLIHTYKGSDHPVIDLEFSYGGQ